ncbi:glutaredoxin family protein [Jeotgalibacillus soli]|nr:glutaredoxin family protein [Jeotgalibacillus soli]
MDVTLYSRPNCALCEEAKLMLKLVQEDIAFNFIELNIEDRDEWTEEYGLMIPVVMVEGEMIQYGQVDYFTLSKRLQKNS